MDDKTLFYLALVILIIITWQYLLDTKEIVYVGQSHDSNQTIQKEEMIGTNMINNTCTSCQTCPVCPICPIESAQYQPRHHKYQSDSVVSPTVINVEAPIPPPPNPLREYDYRTLNDPLVPPLKRNEYDGFIPTAYTRGYPSSYRKMALLIDNSAPNDDKYKFMILVGRLKYFGGNTYDYYVTEHNSESAIKFDLPNLHKELYTDDEITISELGKTYKVQVDRNLGFDYSPFVY